MSTESTEGPENRAAKSPGAETAECENSDRDVIRTLSESFQHLADLSQDAIYLFDIESGTFPFFNRRFLELFGVEEEGRTILSSSGAALHIHPDDTGKLRAARQETLDTGGDQGEVEYRYISPDGPTLWMHDRWSVVRDGQGKAVAIEGFIRDNTQKKQAEDELDHSRKSALIGSYILQKGRFAYVNPEFCRITGYLESELIGKSSMDLVHGDYSTQVRENAMAMLEGQSTTPYEFQIVDRSGQVKWVMETVTSVKHEGLRATLGYFMDVTEQKQIAQEQQDKEKLRAILEMAGAVSHELNNPLQVVLTGIEKLGDPSFASDRKEELIQLVQKHTVRLMELSSKIQRISQYATKDYVGGKKIFDFDAAVKE